MTDDFRFPNWEETKIAQLLEFASASVEERYNWLVQTFLLLEPYLPTHDTKQEDRLK